MLSTQIGYFNGICGENFWNSCTFVVPKAPGLLVVCLCSGRLKVIYWLWSISFSNRGGECLRQEWPHYSWELSKSTKHNFYREVLCKWTTSIIKLSMKLSISFSNLPYLQQVSILGHYNLSGNYIRLPLSFLSLNTFGSWKIEIFYMKLFCSWQFFS